MLLGWLFGYAPNYPASQAGTLLLGYSQLGKPLGLCSLLNGVKARPPH